MLAEGGTHEYHKATTARSRSIWGPYEPNPRNPIVTAANTTEYIQHVGHCDAVEDHEGVWWGVCLAVRKDQDGRWNLGRESFLTPASWFDDWLSFQTVRTELGRPIEQADLSQGLSAVSPSTGLVWIRDPVETNYAITETGDACVLKATAVDFDDYSVSPTFVGKRQRTLAGRSDATLHRNVASASGTLKACLAVYKDEHRFLRVFYREPRSSVVFELVNRAQNLTKQAEHQLSDRQGDLKLQIRYTEKEYQLFYMEQALHGSNGNSFTLVGEIDTLDLVDQDFVGPIVGVFAVAEEENLDVHFSNLSFQ